MENQKTYKGSCHCDAVQFEATMPKAESAMHCNCSHCKIKGLLLAFTPVDTFTITAGEDNLTEYRFNQKIIVHQFCKTCGVQPFAYGQDESGTKMAAINLRTIKDLDIDSLTLTQFNGKDY